MPIFIAWTKSFWFGLVPALLNLMDLTVELLTPATIGPIAAFLKASFGWEQETCENVLRGVATLTTAFVMYQRRGRNQPYTLDPRATK
jgi:hypothetical protein